MEKILGSETHENGYSIFHVWGTLKGEQISRFYATKKIQKLKDKYRRNPQVYIDPASTSLTREYKII